MKNNKEYSSSEDEKEEETIKVSLEKLNIFKNSTVDDLSNKKFLNFEMNMDKLYMIMESQTSKKLNNFESIHSLPTTSNKLFIYKFYFCSFNNEKK